MPETFAETFIWHDESQFGEPWIFENRGHRLEAGSIVITPPGDRAEPIVLPVRAVAAFVAHEMRREKLEEIERMNVSQILHMP